MPPPGKGGGTPEGGAPHAALRARCLGAAFWAAGLWAGDLAADLWAADLACGLALSLAPRLARSAAMRSTTLVSSGSATRAGLWPFFLASMRPFRAVS